MVRPGPPPAWEACAHGVEDESVAGAIGQTVRLDHHAEQRVRTCPSVPGAINRRSCGRRHPPALATLGAALRQCLEQVCGVVKRVAHRPEIAGAIGRERTDINS